MALSLGAHGSPSPSTILEVPPVGASPPNTRLNHPVQEAARSCSSPSDPDLEAKQDGNADPGVSDGALA